MHMTVQTNFFPLLFWFDLETGLGGDRAALEVTLEVGGLKSALFREVRLTRNSEGQVAWTWASM